MWTGVAVRPRTATASLLLAAALAQGCVSAARHESLVAERDRLARENLDLRRALAEQTVRAQEAMEALRAGPAGAPPSPPSAPQTAADPIVPAGTIAPTAPHVVDEEIREPAMPEPARDEEGILRVARHYAAQGNSGAAIAAYSRLIDDHPFSRLLPEAFLERGRLRLGAGDRVGALEDFDTVVEAFPASPQAPEARRLGDSLRRP